MQALERPLALGICQRRHLQERLHPIHQVQLKLNTRTIILSTPCLLTSFDPLEVLNRFHTSCTLRLMTAVGLPLSKPDQIAMMASKFSLCNNIGHGVAGICCTVSGHGGHDVVHWMAAEMMKQFLTFTFVCSQPACVRAPMSVCGLLHAEGVSDNSPIERMLKLAIAI